MIHRLLLVLTLLTTQVSAQQVDSIKYWHQKYDSAAYKVIAARETIWHVQDYINLCNKNPKLNKFDKGWTQRILTTYYKQSNWIPTTRHKKK